ncbi:uncharacterized protein LOC132560820 [Ylistrum balloti]|uniref:uncharacterized protein LOC132560820 n=1 Tax=Ylistrum balloti TaxID=509963 RepID=UPI002905C377|nr:uncharacterized protein LOC132560820 [Ylistrum balloti]
MWKLYTILFVVTVFAVGLVCQYIYTVQTVPITTITKVSNHSNVSANFSSEESHNTSSQHNVRYPVRTCKTAWTYIDFSGALTTKESARVKTCIANKDQELLESRKKAKSQTSIRWSTHSYLNRSSFLIEAGGHRGLDAEQFNSRYHPGTYVVLEPVLNFYKVLKNKFRDSPNMVIYNYGIDTVDGKFYVNEAKNDGSSIFLQHQNKTKNGKAIKIMNVRSFFEKFSVRSRDVDLITLNCEGCEFAVLDLLLSTDYIRHFRNIQFQPHMLPSICYPVKRYCWYQELLQKTHNITFQFFFLWESWSRM